MPSLTRETLRAVDHWLTALFQIGCFLLAIWLITGALGWNQPLFTGLGLLVGAFSKSREEFTGRLNDTDLKLRDDGTWEALTPRGEEILAKCKPGDFTHPGLTTGQGGKAWVSVRPPLTHMGCYVIETSSRYLAFDKSAIKALHQRITEVL